MNQKLIIGIVILAIIIITLISIYIYQSQSIEIFGEEKEEILGYADHMIDMILLGFNEGDYEKLSTDFTWEMREAFTEAVFLENRETIMSKIGLHVSRASPTVLKQGPYTIVIYSAEFEKESGVQVRTVFEERGGRNLVTGLWFNSPKLRDPTT
ncbi:MAG: DUF3887 domain-containing protein [Candidatus Aenigmatarchaeota archaeon]